MTLPVPTPLPRREGPALDLAEPNTIGMHIPPGAERAAAHRARTSFVPSAATLRAAVAAVAHAGRTVGREGTIDNAAALASYAWAPSDVTTTRTLTAVQAEDDDTIKAYRQDMLRELAVHAASEGLSLIGPTRLNGWVHRDDQARDDRIPLPWTPGDPLPPDTGHGLVQLQLTCPARPMIEALT